MYTCVVHNGIHSLPPKHCTQDTTLHFVIEDITNVQILLYQIGTSRYMGTQKAFKTDPVTSKSPEE
jgi:hypothetical protein